MSARSTFCIASFVLPLALFGQTAVPPTNIINAQGSGNEDAFQLSYVSNLNIADGIVNVTNSGASAGSVAPVSGSNISGNMCVNAYVYQAAGNLLSCCSCVTTPNALYSWPVTFGSRALLNNSQSKPNSVLIELVATRPALDSAVPNGVCDPTFQNAPLTLVPGMSAYGTHPHLTAGPDAAITEAPFKEKGLSVGEAFKLQADCRALGAGRQCPACLQGGLSESNAGSGIQTSLR